VVERTVGGVVIVEHPSTKMTEDNILSQIQIEDSLTMATLRGIVDLKFSVLLQ